MFCQTEDTQFEKDARRLAINSEEASLFESPPANECRILISLDQHMYGTCEHVSATAREAMVDPELLYIA